MKKTTCSRGLDALVWPEPELPPELPAESAEPELPAEPPVEPQPVAEANEVACDLPLLQNEAMAVPWRHHKMPGWLLSGAPDLEVRGGPTRASRGELKKLRCHHLWTRRPSRAMRKWRSEAVIQLERSSKTGVYGRVFPKEALFSTYFACPNTQGGPRVRGGPGVEPRIGFRRRVARRRRRAISLKSSCRTSSFWMVFVCFGWFLDDF